MSALQAVGLTDVGQTRSHNEDFFLSDPGRDLYVVCDGMGGHAAGEVASKTTAETIRECLEANPAFPTATPEQIQQMLTHAIEEANRRVFALGQGDSKRRGMGTTCTCVVIRGRKGVMAHVGDSRLYLERGGQIHQLSDDHTFVAEAVRHGIITPEQALESEHTNVVTRAVGPQPQVLVDTLVFDVLPGDTLLLCSDGLCQYFERTIDELKGILASDDLDSIPGRLIGTANERGGDDNITALVLRHVAATASPEEQKAASEITATFRLLHHIQLLSELTHAELSRVSSYLENVEAKPGQSILSQGEVSQGLYVIISGTVEVVREGESIAVLKAGDHFGEMALLNQRPRSATVCAKTPTRMLHLSREKFFDVVQQDHVIGIKFLWRLAQTLSLRLEDAFELKPEESKRIRAMADRTTLTFGRFPSPFHQG